MDILKDMFGDHFDYDRSGEMDAFEKRAAFTDYLEMMKEEKGIEEDLWDMDPDDLKELVAESGVDPSGFGY